MRTAIVSVLLLLAVGVVHADWILETLDQTGTTGYWTAIRLGSNGLLHIVYRDESDNSLVHTWQDGYGWVTEIIDTCDCWFMSMVLDSLDKPRIAYWEHTEETICVVYWTGSDWSTEVIASAQPNGSHWPRTDIEVDSAGQSHVVWFDGIDTAFHYAVKKFAVGWTFTVVDSAGDTGFDPSLCLDSLDLPRVSYCNGTDGYLYYAFLEVTDWYIQTVDSACYSSDLTSLELDGLGTPHILYHRYSDISDSAVNSISYASLGGTSWEVETVGIQNYWYPASPQGLCLDADGYPHLSTHYANLGDFMGYHYKDETGWHGESVDGPGAGWDRAICLDASGSPNISYFYMIGEDLRWAHRSSTGIWSTEETLTGGLTFVPALNPVTGQASVLLELPAMAMVSLSVYDLSGRLLDVMPVTELSPGIHTLVLGEYRPGIYFCEAEVGDLRTRTTFTVIK